MLGIVVMAVLALLAYLIYMEYLIRCVYPPGPRPLPIIGNLHQIDFKRPYRTAIRMRKTYGPVFTLWMPRPNVVIADHAMLKDALLRQGGKFAGRYLGFVFGYFSNHQVDGNGITLCQGIKWQTQKRLSLQIFRNFGMGKSLMELCINRHVSVLTNSLEQWIVNEHKSEAVLELHLPLSYCIGNIIHEILVGKVYAFGDREFKEFKDHIDLIMRVVIGPKLLLLDCFPWVRFFAARAIGLTEFLESGNAIKNFFCKEIQAHRQNQKIPMGEPQDYIEAYLNEMAAANASNLAATDEESLWKRSNAHLLSNEALILNAGDIYAGGMETSMNTLIWSLFYMVHNPEVQHKCHEEITRVLHGRDHLTMPEKASMPYVTATINEVQRIVNILPWNIPHASMQDATLGGHKIKQQTTIIPMISAVHMDPELFPEPERFLPERFLDEKGNVNKMDHFYPFGLGKRSCLGESLAKMELFLVFTALVAKFEFHGVPGQDKPSLEPEVGMTTVPKHQALLVRLRNVA